MEQRTVERRLAAILAADIVGYSRLMEADEAGTLARLKTHRLELIDPAIAKNRGRIIKTTGDGMLVEFPSVVEAVRCAAEIQRRMARRNADVAPARWIQFRIGINLGDVISRGRRHLRRRRQRRGAAGGAGRARRHLRLRRGARPGPGRRASDLAFEDLGEQSVKNIARPIRVFRVLLGREERRRPAPEAVARSRCGPRPTSRRSRCCRSPT